MSSENDLKEELKNVENDLIQIDSAIDKLSTKRHRLLSRKQILKQRLQENASEKLANQDWERSDHPWSDKVNNVLKTMFKMDKFRPYQLSTINAVMSKQNCILLMPTGGGKSLCYQLPAMVLEGITLVISPLVSLMEDQIMAMENLNIPAALLNASSTREHVNHVQKQMTEKNPSIKLLYVTPEKLAKSKRFMAKLEKMYQMGLFSLLAIDEVHCCSQWGHDFRTDYKFLGIMKRQFPKVPILGLTATATSSVISDVQTILNIQGCLVLKASFNRPNLKYEVVCKSSCQKDNVTELANMLKNRFNGLSGIIYCFSIKDSEEIASELKNRGIKAAAYHAQLDAKSRSAVHKRWSTNSLQVIVATVAFGMGIDKPDVRFVIHHSMPKSMENFYQESGRAGRDDNLASCILFFRFPDIFRQSTMVFTEQKGLEHLYAMVAYCLDLSRCRRSIIAQHFGERWDVSDCNSMCDHCDKYSPYIEKTINIAREYKTLVSILEHCSMIEERLTSQKLIDAWHGKGSPRNRPPGLTATTYSRENCERIVGLLLIESYLIEEFHFTPYSTISYINIGSRKLPTNQELLLPMPLIKRKTANDDKDSIINKSTKSTDSSTTSVNKESNSSLNKINSFQSSSPSLKNSQKLSNSSTASSSSKASSSLKDKGEHSALKKESHSQQKKTSSNKRSVELCVINEKKSHFNNGVIVGSKRASIDLTAHGSTSTSSKKVKTEQEIVLSDDDITFEIDFDNVNKKHAKQKSPDIIISDDIELSDSELKFDDYDVKPSKKKNPYKRIVSVTVSDSD